MKVRIQDLYAELNKIINKNAANAEWISLVEKHISKKYNIPHNDVHPFIVKSHDFNVADECTLYAIAEELLQDKIEDFYTEIEIKSYQTDCKRSVKKITTLEPIPAIKINDGQYICMVDVNQLYQWNGNNLIYYNPRTQRPMKIINKSGITYKKISINKKSVEEIKKEMSEETFISNTLTFNVREENGELIYQDGMLYIDNFVCFDLVDGYHRYLAAMQNKSTNASFNLNFELRILAYPEEKVRQFIWQEDQKNKLSTVVSDSMNQNIQYVKVVNMVKSNDLIAQYLDKSIEEPTLAKAISVIYFNGSKNTSKQPKELVLIKNEIIKTFNELTSDDPDAFETKWATNRLCIALLLGQKNIYDNKLILEYASKLQKSNYKRQDFINLVEGGVQNV